MRGAKHLHEVKSYKVSKTCHNASKNMAHGGKKTHGKWGAKRMSKIRKVLSNPDVKCVFTEPQFEPKIVTAILDGTDKKSVEIDLLGANIKAGPNLYFTLLQKMSASFKTCLN